MTPEPGFPDPPSATSAPRPPRATAATPTVHLVGAGPGDPELLTLRAWRLIQQAQVVVHDRLVSPQVLALAGPRARLIDVGKRPGGGYKQPEINTLLVRLGLDGRRVVRLKGGDPCVFGRAGEELDALRRHGIAVELVPGVTAATAAAAAAGISLTRRGVASALTLMTGRAAADAGAAADGPPTVALYMGVAEAAAATARLLARGYAGTTPVVVVENASAPGQRLVRGTLAGLPALLRRHRVSAPALVLIGEVAAPAAALPAAPVGLAV